MLGRIRKALGLIPDPALESARRRARLFFAEAFPRLEIAEMRLIARVEGGHVLAVIYRTGMPSRPLPYKIVEVGPDAASAREIDRSERPEYVLRGRK